MARFTKGKPKTGGRKKGMPNKLPSALKDVVLQALANAGGVAYFEQQARKNPVAFMALLGRILPLQVKEASQDPILPAPVIHQHFPG